MGMRHTERELERLGDTDLAKIVNVVHDIFKRRHPDLKDIPFPLVAKRLAMSRVQEQTAEVLKRSQEFRLFTPQEKKALRKDGATILTLSGETIKDQRISGRLFWSIVNGGDRLLRFPSIKAEIAVYLDPKNFFVPNSGNKRLPEQEILVEKDAQDLRKRTGLGRDITMIIPDSASILTEITFKHLDKTSRDGKPVWLFGENYAVAQGLQWVYGRTKNSVNESADHVAMVGNARAELGLKVDRWHRDGRDEHLLAVRLVIAKKAPSKKA